jgi:hypothetical protein
MATHHQTGTRLESAKAMISHARWSGGDGKTGRNKNETDPSSSVPDRDAAELLAALFDLAGFFPPRDGSSSADDAPVARLQLASSLTDLIGALNDGGGGNVQSTGGGGAAARNEDGGDGEPSAEFLLRLEGSAAAIRNRADALGGKIAEEREEALLLERELEALLAEGGQRSWRAFVRAFVSEHGRQGRREECTAASLQRTLDVLYDGDAANWNEWTESLRSARRCLRREMFRSQPVLQDALILLQEGSGTRNTFDIDESLWTTAIQTFSGPPKGPVECNQSITSADTVLGAFQSFLGSSPVEAHVTFVLAVGPEGSGKTHICDKMEEMTDSCAVGTCIVGKDHHDSCA